MFIGCCKGGFVYVYVVDFGGFVLKMFVECNVILVDEYDDVVFGCVDMIGLFVGNIVCICWFVVGLLL